MEMRPLTQEDMERLLLPNLSPKLKKILDEEGGVDYSYIIGQDECRFRVSLFKQRSRLSLVARTVVGMSECPVTNTIGRIDPRSMRRSCSSSSWVTTSLSSEAQTRTKSTSSTGGATAATD